MLSPPTPAPTLRNCHAPNSSRSEPICHGHDLSLSVTTLHELPFTITSPVTLFPFTTQLDHSRTPVPSFPALPRSFTNTSPTIFHDPTRSFTNTSPVIPRASPLIHEPKSHHSHYAPLFPLHHSNHFEPKNLWTTRTPPAHLSPSHHWIFFGPL